MANEKDTATEEHSTRTEKEVTPPIATGENLDKEARSSESKIVNLRKKGNLNRREYISLGAAAAATALGTTALAKDVVATEGSNSFRTDFSEYAL